MTDRKVPFLDLRREIASLEDELLDAVRGALRDSDFILGKTVDAFEQRFASFVGCAHAIGVSNGLDALALTLAALDIGPGDEVIVPANTFIASALAVSDVGATPVLVDCGPDLLIDVDAARAAVTARTRAIMPVHLTGQPADMVALARLAAERNLVLIEDAAQAHGARVDGRVCGALGIAGCFSFYPTKNLGALGDAGMVTTDDATLAARIRRLANYGKTSRSEHAERGRNCRLDTLQAALLLVKLDHLDESTAQRRAVAAGYAARLANLPGLGLPIVHADREPVWHLYVVTHAARDALRAHLAAHGIGTLVHYDIPIHLQPAYRDLGHRAGDFPVAERLARDSLSLPFFPLLTAAEQDHVTDCIRSFVLR